jgi:2-dehydro-3-deoxygluconokinase
MPGKLVTFGETMGLFQARDIGRLRTGAACRVSVGGAEANVAMAAARLGAPAIWCGRLGTDSLGDLVEQTLRAADVQTVIARDRAPTGIMVKHERFGGDVHVDYHRAASAGSRITPADVPESALAESAVVHTTGITPAVSAGARETVFDVLDRAARRGVAVSFDVNFRSKLWTRDAARPVLTEILRRSDIVFAGVEEAELMLGERLDPTEAAHAMARISGAREVIIKRGAEGCTALVDGQVCSVPAPVVPVIDLVGAGDAFVGAYLAERLAGAPVEHRLATAVAVGALAVATPGDCENLPSREDLESLSRRDVHR